MIQNNNQDWETQMNYKGVSEDESTNLENMKNTTMYRKSFIHNTIPFTIDVRLNTIVECSMNGKRMHTVNTKCPDLNIQITRDIEDKKLIDYIESTVKIIHDRIDNSVNETPTVEYLEKIGFSVLQDSQRI